MKLKPEVKKIMRDYYISDEEEMANSIDFVYEILCFLADDCEKNYPYASNTIRELENAAYRVRSVMTDEDLYESEDK